MFWIYILKSDVKKYIYIGLTNNLERRITQHNRGTERTTAPYRPFTLLHSEQFNTRIEARAREKFLKSGVGREWIYRQLLKT